MSYQEKLKHKFPQEDQEKKKTECDPTSTMTLNKEQCWQFQCSLRETFKTMREQAIHEALKAQ